MSSPNSQTFEMKENILCFDGEKRILVAKNAEDGRNVWAKKIHDIHFIAGVIEDERNYYLSCEFDDAAGYYLAASKENGSTLWYIPGRPFFNILFDGYLYLIFIDDEEHYFLIKVERSTGDKIWYHRIDPDLTEYSFKGDRILLSYGSGKEEMLSPRTGFPVNRP